MVIGLIFLILSGFPLILRFLGLGPRVPVPTNRREFPRFPFLLVLLLSIGTIITIAGIFLKTSIKSKEKTSQVSDTNIFYNALHHVSSFGEIKVKKKLLLKPTHKLIPVI
jgi:hypothetical protein